MTSASVSSRPRPVSRARAFDLSAVEAARRRLAPGIRLTPCHAAPALTARAGRSIWLKREDLQRTGSFKERGARHALLCLEPAERTRGVVAASAGNHALGLAYHGAQLGVSVTVVMPATAPAVKVSRCRTLGAQVILHGATFEAAHRHALALAAATGATFVHPFDDRRVMAGQGTLALELVEDAAAAGLTMEAMLACTGGGGLIAGCAVAAAHLSPGTHVVGIEPEAGNDTQQSLARGEIVHIPTPRTIADGAQTQHSGQLTFPVIQRLVERIETVSDEQLVRTMRFFAERMKLVVEPTGCLAAAALLEGVVPARGQRVGVVVSGGNVDLARYAALLSGGPAAAG